jgi:hypothetical protein
VLLILLAWVIDLGCYFDHEERYRSKPRRHASKLVMVRGVRVPVW